MNTLGIVLVCICALLAVLFIVARVLKGGILGVLMKTLASFGFVASGIAGVIVSNININFKWTLGLIVIGLLLGMIGDIVLDLKVVYPGNDKYYLNAGMLSFFLGHVCYISAFTIWANPIQRFTSSISIGSIALIAVAIAVVLTIGIVLSSKKMGLKFGNYLIQTIAYTLILTFSTAYTLVLAMFGAGLWLTFVAMLVFFLSDIVLSFQYFGGKLDNKILIIINHILYYTAQILLVALLFVL
jgi:hypothetical protein